jgi:hypothetical protein
MRGLLILLMGVLLIAGSVAANEKAAESRLDEVQRRGLQVMPFSLDQTMHIFTRTDQGGIQQVVAKENAGAEQVRLIREHLAESSRQFAQGDFFAPAKIHGEDMPGLAALRAAKPGQIRIEYSDLENGGQIVYSADDPGLTEAIHQWFDAQLKDHARHAIPGHTHDPSHGH